MLKRLHKPQLIQSDIPYGEGNVITQEIVSDKEMFVTEYWEKKPSREWIDAGIYTAKKGYKWTTRWKLGKNYITTKILNENGELIGFYWDITSQVKKINKQFQAYDWYLDIFKISDKKIVLLDEDELEQALKIGFITKEQAETAKKTAEDIIEKAQSGVLDF